MGEPPHVVIRGHLLYIGNVQGMLLLAVRPPAPRCHSRGDLPPRGGICCRARLRHPWTTGHTPGLAAPGPEKTVTCSVDAPRAKASCRENPRVRRRSVGWDLKGVLPSPRGSDRSEVLLISSICPSDQFTRLQLWHHLSKKTFTWRNPWALSLEKRQTMLPLLTLKLKGRWSENSTA